jgi:hypothetical protein
MLLFSDLVTQVKQNAIRNQGGTEFDSEIKAGINESIMRIARETMWINLRRTDTFDTKTSYTTGTGAVTVNNGSKAVTVTGATFLTDGIEVGRRCSLGGSQIKYTVKTITGETTFTVDINYDGTSSTTQSYKIWPKEEYTLPAQCGQLAFMYHEAFNYPYIMKYIPNLEFWQSSTTMFYSAIPIYYKTWISDMVLQSPIAPSVVTVSSSSASDVTQKVIVFGLVNGYPDQEALSLNGLTSVNGTKSFSKIDRIIKDSSSVGLITCTSNSAKVTLAVIPVGDNTAGIQYKKVSLWPLPSVVTPINVWYYKQPWRLVNDYDVHELGQEFDHAIVLLTTAKIRYQNSSTEGNSFMAMYADEIKSLKKVNGDKLDFINVLKRPEDSRFLGEGIHPQLLYRQLGGTFGGVSYR